MSDTWGPRAHPNRDTWDAQEQARRHTLCFGEWALGVLIAVILFGLFWWP